MDLLHSEKLDGFCLVSSDSDFTRLAPRIREAGLSVYGFSEKKTPVAFVAACHKFIYTGILRTATPVDADHAAPRKTALVKSLISLGDTVLAPTPLTHSANYA